MGIEQNEAQPEFRLQVPAEGAVRRERMEENRQSQQLYAKSSVQGPDVKVNYELNSDQAMERLVSTVLGQRIRVHKVSGLGRDNAVRLMEPVNPPGRELMVSMETRFTSYQYEKISLHSSGSVSLADGRDISFSLDLSMERESMVQESVAWQEASGLLMDPLVFQFDADLRSLANRSFQFDIDSDGALDEISSLRPGSGFLALDINGDRRINNGLELFGPTTGSGFFELGLHDLDGNGWIDENDPIFEKLLIWKPGVQGDPSLIGLKEAGVGAISLSHSKSSFQLRDQNNSFMGEVAASGFFLTEDGEVKSVQEIKFALGGQDGVALGDMGALAVAEAAGREAVMAQTYLRQMALIRQLEVQQLTGLRVMGRNEQERDELLSELFPNWKRERGLESVLARSRDNPTA
jgi:hypothetical protein